MSPLHEKGGRVAITSSSFPMAQYTVYTACILVLVVCCLHSIRSSLSTAAASL